MLTYSSICVSPYPSYPVSNDGGGGGGGGAT